MSLAVISPRQAHRSEFGRWPYRPRPIPNELLSSYIGRLSRGLGMKPISFLNSVMGSRKNLLAQDLDNFAPLNLLQQLAIGSQVDIESLQACTLGSYQGALNINHNKRGRNPWVLPTTIDNNVRHRPGLQFCPMCLLEDRPHFRKPWRLGFVTACTTHGTMLRDRCPHCHELVRPLQSSEAWRCFSCDESLRVETVTAPAQLLTWQKGAEQALENGWAKLGDQFISSTTWFIIMRQVATLLVNGPKAEGLRKTTVQLYGGTDDPFPKPTERQPFEFLEVADRLRLFTQVAKLTKDWPHRFVQASFDAGLCKSHAIKDMPYVPFAFDAMLRTYLDATPYHASDAEVAAVASWLRKTKGAAYYRDLKAICGESRRAIYRHMDYQRQQKHPSVWHERIQG